VVEAFNYLSDALLLQLRASAVSWRSVRGDRHVGHLVCAEGKMKVRMDVACQVVALDTLGNTQP